TEGLLVIFSDASNPAAGQAQDRVTVTNVDNVAAPVLVGNTAGSTALIVDDSASQSARTVTVDNNLVLGLTRPGTYVVGGTGVSSLEVKGSSGVNVYNVEGTAAGTPVTITAAGFETFNVTPSSQELGLIQSDLTINTGRVASVFINDQNGAALAGHSVPATYSVLPFTIFTQSLVHEGLQVQSTNAAGRVFINGPGGLTL